MIPSMLKDTLTTAIGNRMPVMLVGAPGIGKTDVVWQSLEETYDTDLPGNTGDFGPPLFLIGILERCPRIDATTLL